MQQLNFNNLWHSGTGFIKTNTFHQLMKHHQESQHPRKSISSVIETISEGVKSSKESSIQSFQKEISNIIDSKHIISKERQKEKFINTSEVLQLMKNIKKKNLQHLSKSYISNFTSSNRFLVSKNFEFLETIFIRQRLNRLIQTYISIKDSNLRVKFTIKNDNTFEEFTNRNSSIEQKNFSIHQEEFFKKSTSSILSRSYFRFESFSRNFFSFDISEYKDLSLRIRSSARSDWDQFLSFFFFHFIIFDKLLITDSTTRLNQEFFQQNEDSIHKNNMRRANNLKGFRITEFENISPSKTISPSQSNHQVKAQDENIPENNMSSNSKKNENSDENENSNENENSTNSDLSQTNIQGIAMFMFQMFIQNIQEVRTNLVIASVSSRSQFRATDIEFFDFQLNSQYDIEDVIQLNKNIYFRDVFLFVERIKDTIIILKTKKIRTNLFICLRGTAQIGYTERFNDLEKKILRSLKNEVDRGCETLMKKFKQFVFSAFQNLTAEKYILNDVRSRRNISSFVFQTMRHVKIVNISDLHEQFIGIYNAIISKIVRNIDSSNENISVAAFLDRLENRKKIGFKIYFRKSNLIKNNYFYQFKKYQFRQNFSIEKNHDSSS